MASTFDTLKNRGAQLDAQEAAAMGTPPAAPAPAAAPAAPVAAPAVAAKPAIVRGTANPDNNLPQTEGIFHKALRMFKS